MTITAKMGTARLWKKRVLTDFCDRVSDGANFAIRTQRNNNGADGAIRKQLFAAFGIKHNFANKGDQGRDGATFSTKVETVRQKSSSLLPSRPK